jgi:intracellular septation protein
VGALVIGLLGAKRVPILPIISTIFVVISGCITLQQHQPEALIISDSLYYFFLAVVVATGLSFRFNVLKYFFGHTFAMRDEGWDILAFRWMTIFIVAGAANEWVRIMLTPEDWMNFRFLKVITLTLFGCLQIYTARRYRIPDQSNSWGLRTEEAIESK